MLEYNHDELDMESLRSLYRPTSRLESRGTVRLDELIDLLEWVKRILAAQYPSGLGLRALLQALDRAVLSISKWDGKPRGKIYRELSGPGMVTLQQPG